MIINKTENKSLGSAQSDFGYITSLIESHASTLSVLNLPFGENIRDIELIAFPIGTQIPDSRYVLQQYIPAELERTVDGFIIRCHSIDEEAFGDTYKRAYFDFLTSIRDHYESLVKREGRLSRRDKDVLEKLRSLFQGN